MIEDQKVILSVPLKDRVHDRAESMRSSQYVFMPGEKESVAQPKAAQPESGSFVSGGALSQSALEPA